MENIHQIKITDLVTLTYQTFGKPLHSAPVILINHALTGNSRVSGQDGWWNNLVGYNQTIDLDYYTVIAFDVPGNGYNEQQSQDFQDYKYITTQKVAQYFWQALQKLEVKKLFALIGASLGGCIAWEMFFQHPQKIKHLIPIATSYKSSNWLIANVLVQDSILNNSTNPIHDARMHAMLLYRTPESLEGKFKNNQQIPQQNNKVEDWLKYHGQALQHRFSLSSYKIMNHLLKTTALDKTEAQIQQLIINCSTNIHSIAINTDYMFTYQEQCKAYDAVKNKKANYHFSQIQSIHGHDAFLIEYQQLNQLLTNIFK